MFLIATDGYIWKKIYNLNFGKREVEEENDSNLINWFILYKDRSYCMRYINPIIIDVGLFSIKFASVNGTNVNIPLSIPSIISYYTGHCWGPGNGNIIL